MKSYPSTRFGKIHIRSSGDLMTGETYCGRIAGDGASVSKKTTSAATCLTCIKRYQMAITAQKVIAVCS